MFSLCLWAESFAPASHPCHGRETQNKLIFFNIMHCSFGKSLLFIPSLAKESSIIFLYNIIDNLNLKSAYSHGDHNIKVPSTGYHSTWNFTIFFQEICMPISPNHNTYWFFVLEGAEKAISKYYKLLMECSTLHLIPCLTFLIDNE